MELERDQIDAALAGLELGRVEAMTEMSGGSSPVIATPDTPSGLIDDLRVMAESG
ncbi:MAG TPA: hypothetical protein VN155_19470 [Devosia sp.]|nr:hypothetical protein [Devosia sp.]